MYYCYWAMCKMQCLYLLLILEMATFIIPTAPKIDEIIRECVSKSQGIPGIACRAVSKDKLLYEGIAIVITIYTLMYNIFRLLW